MCLATMAEGVAQAFAAAIEQAFSQPGTVGVGYNTIRYDDEVTRFLFWRNLIDPYAREWQNHCGRWDILDLVRTAYALRPEGIEWPKNEDGRPSFRLEHLTAKNGIAHTAAHDALSDVRATIDPSHDHELDRPLQEALEDFARVRRRTVDLLHGWGKTEWERTIDGHMILRRKDPESL